MAAVVRCGGLVAWAGVVGAHPETTAQPPLHARHACLDQPEPLVYATTARGSSGIGRGHRPWWDSLLELVAQDVLRWFVRSHSVSYGTNSPNTARLRAARIPKADCGSGPVVPGWLDDQSLTTLRQCALDRGVTACRFGLKRELNCLDSQWCRIISGTIEGTVLSFVRHPIGTSIWRWKDAMSRR